MMKNHPIKIWSGDVLYYDQIQQTDYLKIWWNMIIFYYKFSPNYKVPLFHQITENKSSLLTIRVKKSFCLQFN